MRSRYQDVPASTLRVCVAETAAMPRAQLAALSPAEWAARRAVREELAARTAAAARVRREVAAHA